MSNTTPVRTAADLVYPPAELGPTLWQLGVRCLELLGQVQGSAPLTENLLCRVVEDWGALRTCLQNDLDWWVSDDAPAFEPTASSHIEAVFRRLERIARYAFYAGHLFGPEGFEFPPPENSALDYELASAFLQTHVAPIDLAAAATGLRKEVIRNMARPVCRLPWGRLCVGEWRFRLFADMLGSTPAHHWELAREPLLRAVRDPSPDAKASPRLIADPDTRSMSLDGREIATQLDPDLFGYVGAILAAHPHAIPFKAIRKAKGLSGTNSTRLRKKLERHSRALSKLIATNHTGHFLKLPPVK